MPPLVPAVTRAIDILETFRGDARPLSVPELAARLGLPRSTAHDLVRTLVGRGYLRALDDQPHKFVLGLRVFELGSAYADSLDLPREGRRMAAAVSAVCDETVHVAVLDGTEVVYIAKVDSTQAVRMVSAVGRRLPAHRTAVGKMLLSGLSDRELAGRYGRSKSLASMTPNSITSLPRLRRELAVIRARGMAFDDCESNIDVRCVAAPVYDRDGHMAAALSISVPMTRMRPKRREELAALVKQGAQDLSRRLGFQARAARPALRTAGG